jgi:hypothetical protein
MHIERGKLITGKGLLKLARKKEKVVEEVGKERSKYTSKEGDI